MNDTFTHLELESLLSAGHDRCLSLFMPTAKAGPEVKQNSIRFKNLLTEAEASFSRKRVPPDVSESILGPLRRLVNDNIFWANQSVGFAVLRSLESLHTYRLPMECNELIVLADHFHLKPLMRYLQDNRSFYVLAFSQNRTKLLRCSRKRVTEIEPPNMPRSLAQALKYDDPQRQLQFHTGAPGTGGERAAMFHGHGVGIDETKDNVLRYSYHVSKSLEPMLRQEKVPLILATVDYLFPIYKAANTYAMLLEDFVKGNPDRLSDEDLMNQAWPIVEKRCREEEAQAIHAFREKVGTGLTSTDLKEVVVSARSSRVDSLFVAGDLERWGVVDETGNEITFHANRQPDSYDLLNFAAVQTLLHGGSVLVLPQERMPGESSAAVFRY